MPAEPPFDRPRVPSTPEPAQTDPVELHLDPPAPSPDGHPSLAQPETAAQVRDAVEEALPADDVVGPDLRERHGQERELGDFTTPWRTVKLVPLAVVIGGLGAFVALALLDLIAAITNLAYFGQWSLELRSPAANQLGWFAVLIPVVGSLIV